MTVRSFTNLGDAARAIQRDMAARKRRLDAAVKKTSRQTRNYVVRTVPRAFAELADSIHPVDIGPGASNVIADAPHAAAVENGSRPHWAPLEPLIAWVKLRGAQGLDAAGNVKSNRTRSGAVKDPRREAARHIAMALQNAPLRNVGGTYVTASDEPERLARAIQVAIAKRGTKPHHFMGNAVEPTMGFLDRFVRDALPDKD